MFPSIDLGSEFSEIRQIINVIDQKNKALVDENAELQNEMEELTNRLAIQERQASRNARKIESENRRLTDLCKELTLQVTGNKVHERELEQVIAHLEAQLIQLPLSQSYGDDFANLQKDYLQL